VCAACSIISVLTQWGATLVIKLRERCVFAFLRQHDFERSKPQTPLSVAAALRTPASLPRRSTHQSGHRAPPQPQKSASARLKSVAPLILRHTQVLVKQRVTAPRMPSSRARGIFFAFSAPLFRYPPHILGLPKIRVIPLP
jgi:hypothetical protein